MTVFVFVIIIVRVPGGIMLTMLQRLLQNEAGESVLTGQCGLAEKEAKEAPASRR